jgi:ABC-type transporter Mla subunit MlaD
MIKSILKALFVLVVFILVYNYFFGTAEEKDRSKAIFNEVAGVTVSVKELLLSEKGKFNEGKYDNAIKEMRGLFSNLEANARELAPELVDQAKDLERRRQNLEGQLDRVKEQKDNLEERGDQIEELNKDMDSLMQDAQRLMKDIQKKS